jgi:cellulose synthase/poly-beta-1,6-N-acetylglucosamine synthase-like glycosyltransferase
VFFKLISGTVLPKELNILYDVFRYGYIVFFITLQAALLFGCFLEWLRDRRSLKTCQQNGYAKISIIIPIHNEKERIQGLLATLLVQSYPAQIIFIDDRSTDESPAILAQFANDAAQRGINCRVITLAENPGLNRKQFALSKGIAASDGDYLLFTDGDCSLPPGWVSAMASRIQDEKTGAVIGPVFKKKQNEGFLSLYQCYDHIVRYNYLAGAIGLGVAGGCFGNNMIINRKALETTGGYDAVASSPTEDAALISHLRRAGKFRIRAAMHIDAAVETAAEGNWLSFINQTLRWNNGGLFSPEPLTRFNYSLLMIVIAAGTIAVLFLPFFPGLWLLPAGVFIVMVKNTIAAFGLFRSKLPQGGLRLKLAWFLSMLFMPVYLTLMTLMGFARIKTSWKETTTPP